jgi:Uma2 family endonuclease
MSATTIRERPTRLTVPEGEQCVAMRHVGWEGYSKLLEIRGDRSMPRLLYLDGTVWLMSPSFTHEFFKKRLGRFVEELAAGLRIPFVPSGATTLRIRDEEGGVEADESYYIVNAPRVLGKKELTLPDDPPPDLVIEVVHTNPADDAVEVHRRFRVPEVWVWEDGELEILVLGPDGDYAASETSGAFPFLRASEIAGWIGGHETGSETDWALELRDWISGVLRPRLRPPQA